MILREARRFFRSARVLTVSAVLVLALGLGTSGLALGLLLAFSSPVYPGLRHEGFATLGPSAGSGSSMHIAWNTIGRLRASVGGGTRMAAWSGPVAQQMSVNGASRPLLLAVVSNGFFGAFTEPLAAGRDFSASEAEQKDSRSLIVSAALARRQFGSISGALGRFIRIQGTAYQVIGVAPAAFHGLFGQPADAWAPAGDLIPLVFQVSLPPQAPPDIWKAVNLFYGVAASDHASSAELAAELNHWPKLRDSVAAPLTAVPGLTSDPERDAKTARWMRLGLLLALVFAVVSSLNYGLLLLARAPRLAEEVRLRRALGADSRNVMAELMAGPLAIMAAGLLLAWGLCAAGAIAAARIPGFYGEAVRGAWHSAIPVIAVMAALAILLTALIALVPAAVLVRDRAMPNTGYTATSRTGWLLQATVTLQIAFCIGTCLLAGMMVSGLLHAMRTPLGYNTAGLTVVEIGPGPHGVSFSMGPNQTFPTAGSIRSLFEQIRALPGVESVSYTSVAPFEDEDNTVGLQLAAGGPARTVNEIIVSPDYFRTIGARLIEGRDLPAHVANPQATDVVLNQSLARQLWPGQDPLGRTVTLSEAAQSGIPAFTYQGTVVGIVADMRMGGFLASTASTVLVPLAGGDAALRVIVKGSVSQRSLEQVAAQQVPLLMPGLIVHSTYHLADVAEESLLPEQERAAFALAGTLTLALLACLGLYGSLAYYVGTRRRELAVRICFGASAWRIRRIVVLRAAWCALAAGALSLPLWPLLSRLTVNDYFGLLTWSPAQAAAILAGCVLMALIVALLPAMAAVRISPAEMLRSE